MASPPAACAAAESRSLGVTLRDPGRVDTSRAEASPAGTCAPHSTLRGAGELFLDVDTQALEALRACAAGSRRPVRLSINGVDLDTDAELVGDGRRRDMPGRTTLRYRILPGEHSQKLWASLHRSSGLFDAEALEASLGLAGMTPAIVMGAPDAEQPVTCIALNSRPAFFWAAVLAIVLVLLAIVLLLDTGALRDGPPPPWLRQARQWRQEHAAAQPPVALDAWLQGRMTNHDPARRRIQEALATQALDGTLAVTDANRDDVLSGLLSTADTSWTTAQSTFSLARTQLAVWFIFAVVAAVYFILVYGQLQPLDNSLLALLGISVGTSGVSMALDKSQPGNFTRSRGFFKDLVIGGPDNKDQVHRHQAVIVNVFLLVVGIAHVLRHVTYPIFDDTWLVFLGVSGLAYAGGKQIVEKR